jgi:predicted RNA-binding Zn ribbon-like protein
VRTFDLSGGRTCLDFANTLSRRLEKQPLEYLERFEDLVSFGDQAEALDAGDAERLQAEAARDPDAAEAVRVRAVALREALFLIFAALAAGQAPPADALALFNRELPDALAHLSIEATPDGCRWRWDSHDGGMERVLWPVLRSAAELMASPKELATLRLCASESCAWLFLDKSRNRSRRWCAMNVCGNRDKVRRHYRRVRAAR